MRFGASFPPVLRVCFRFQSPKPARLASLGRGQLAPCMLRVVAPANYGSIIYRKEGMKRITYSTALLSILAGIGIIGVAHADTKNSRIAFSNNYAGNSWRQAMLKSYDIVTKKAVADGVVAAADVFTTADKEVPTQAAQIQNLILQGYNAIVINASSPDALNGAIKQATDAGIVVVSFDGIVTERQTDSAKARSS